MKLFSCSETIYTKECPEGLSEDRMMIGEVQQKLGPKCGIGKQLEEG